MSKHSRNRWKSNTPVNMAIELNNDRDDEPTQQVHVTDPDNYSEDLAELEDREPTQRRRMAHSYSGCIDDLKVCKECGNESAHHKLDCSKGKK